MKKEVSLLYSSKALCEQTIGRSSDLSPFATFPIQLTCISGFFSRTTLLPVSSVVRTHSSGSVTDSHRIPFSIRALLLIPTIYINLLSANRVQRYCFSAKATIPKNRDFFTMSATATPIYKHYLHRDQQPSISKTTRKRLENETKKRAESKQSRSRVEAEKEQRTHRVRRRPRLLRHILCGAIKVDLNFLQKNSGSA